MVGQSMSDTDVGAADGLRIDIVSDVMCPWCYVGKRRLETALASVPDIPVTVEWHPFQLDPTLPKEGKDRRQYLVEKFGGPEQAATVYQRIVEAGATEDIAFAFDKITRSPNTLNAHRLIRWAGIESVQDEVVERLFQLYFLEGADLTDDTVLVEAGTSAGMDGEMLTRLFASDADLAETQAEVARAQTMGVTGVPCFILDRKYVVSGAQPAHVLANAIRQVDEARQTGTDLTAQPH